MKDQTHSIVPGRRALLAGALAIAVLLGQAAAADSRYPPKEHLPVDYAEMAYTGFDETALHTALDELRRLCQSPAIRREDGQVRARAEALYSRVLAEVDRLATQYTLISLQCDSDVTDLAAAGEAAALSDQCDQLLDACYTTLQLLLDTPYEDIVAADAGSAGLAGLREYRQATAAEFGLYQEETRLVQAYDQAMAQPVQVTVDGQVWTEETLYDDTELDDDGYLAILTALEQARNEAVGDLYLQLVRVRTEIAQAAGYSNYADYAYQEVYGRDFSPQDIRAVYQDAKTYLTPLDARIRGALSARDLRELDVRSRGGAEARLDAIQPYMERLDPELGETFAFLRDHRLYDIEYSQTKLATGYTVSLPAYGSAFIFDSPYGDYQDFNTAIHEFGHFNETFHSTAGVLWEGFRIDVGEIHSQGLEVLFTAYAQDLFDSSGRTFTWATLSNMVDSVLEGCLYDEFQNAVYRSPEMTLTEMNRLFKDLSQQYGYAYEADEEESYFWVENTHTFQSPLYYISYATSALSAIDLWLLSLEDWDRAVEIYMDLTVLAMSKPYREAVETVGLGDIFQPDAVRDLAEGMARRLETDLPGETGSPRPDGLLWITVAVTAAAAMTAAGAAVVLVRMTRKPAAPQGTSWEEGVF